MLSHHCEVICSNPRKQSEGHSSVPRGAYIFTFAQKQGILPLWFCDKEDYSAIGHTDIIETQGLERILQGSGESSLSLRITRQSGENFEIKAFHTLSRDQLEWLREGSALNCIRKKLST
jgi:homoaconitase